MTQSKMLIDSEGISNLKKGDHIFNTELQSTEDGVDLITKEFIFEKYLDKKDRNHIKELDLAPESIPAEMFDVNYTKTPVHADISCGYFSSEKESALGFIHNFQDLVNLATACYVKKYGQI